MSRKIGAMHDEYGVSIHECKDCCNLCRFDYRSKRNLIKCEAYGITHSEATDWRAKYMGCGLFNIPFESTGRRPMIDVLKRRTRQDDTTPIDGQIGMGV